MRFLSRTSQNLRNLLKLVLMSEYKVVHANTCLVEQGDVCKYLYFITKGKMTIARAVDFIEELSVPLEQQMTFVEGLDRDTQVLSTRFSLAY